MKSQSQVAPSVQQSSTSGVTQALRGASQSPTGLARLMSTATKAAAPTVQTGSSKNSAQPQPQATPTTQPQMTPTTAQNVSVAPKSQAQPGLNYGKNQIQPRPQDAVQAQTSPVAPAASASTGKSMAQPGMKGRAQPPVSSSAIAPEAKV